MHQYIKVVGVSPDGIARLYHALDNPAMMSKGNKWAEAPSGTNGRIPFVKLLGAKREQSKGTYTVELEVLISQEVSLLKERTRFLLFAPKIVLDLIYNALQPGFYPIEEEARLLPGLREDRHGGE